MSGSEALRQPRAGAEGLRRAPRERAPRVLLQARTGPVGLPVEEGVLFLLPRPVGTRSATEPDSRQGATAPRCRARGHDRDPRGQPTITRRVSFPLPFARHLMRVEMTWADPHAAHGRRSAQSPDAGAGARRRAGGTGALGAPGDRAARDHSSRHVARAPGRRRGAHPRIPQGAPAGHGRRDRQAVERRPRQCRRRPGAHGQGPEDHEAARGRIAITLSRRVTSQRAPPIR